MVLLASPSPSVPSTMASFGSAAAKGLLYAVFAADLGNDLDGDGSALILLPPDKHTTKVAICRGTPKFDSLSVSHAAVGPIF